MTGPSPYDGLEPFVVEGLGVGYLAPANARQNRDLVVFEKKGAPKDEAGRPVFGVRYGDWVPVCGSKKRQKEGEVLALCGDEGRMGNGRCKIHGGRSLKGAASPTWKDGNRSIYRRRVAGHLTERVEQLRHDPELTHHRTSIAQLDAMLEELWTHYEESWDPQLARRCQATYRAIEAANDANNRPRAMELFATLGQQLGALVSVTNQSEKIVRYLAERRRHADSETRRKLAENLVFSLEEAHTFYTALGVAINKHVTDPEEKRAVLDEIAAVAGSARPNP